ncbi:methyl-accepting chemotaxis protein [Acuticoccus sp. MNP-M23]|uniref:methyl-accepting chemotaxis protein n=1 Tax=Acuticoccus sp. MNP-M23 TaxID=3072793 RepID=UPI002814CD6F|nr:methyl-accepting chemotaxis protein [Acuticoccus sp. MNP-M23]WMS41328.1 methyl-accepting chemotaxis protein [Acuticoccus sp. MNP-M23]
MKLGMRIQMVAAVPLIGLLLVASTVVWFELDKLERTGQAVQHVREAKFFAAAVHELQKERGLSAGFIGNPDSPFRGQLETQRHSTDDALNALLPVLQAEMNINDGVLNAEDIDNARRQIAMLPDWRRAVSGGTMPLGDMAKAYTGLINELLEGEGHVSTVNTQGETSRVADYYHDVMAAKEAAGLQRAMGANGFGSGTFAPSVYIRFVSLAATQNALLEHAAHNAPAVLRGLIETTLSGPVVDRFTKMVKVAEQSPRTEDHEGITGQDWFETSTARIELLKEIEDGAGVALVALAEADQAQAKLELVIVCAATLIVFVLCLIVSTLAARSLRRPIATVVSEIGSLADGNVNIAVGNVDRTDEIGAIARALETLRQGQIERRRLVEDDRLRVEADEARAKRIEAAIGSFRTRSEDTLEEMSSTGHGLADVSKELATAATLSREETTDAQTSNSQATAAVQNVASAIEELQNSVSEIAERIRQNQSATDEAAIAAGATSDRVMGLAGAADRIGDITKVIADIAEQTNLLALNATIEAERAGSAGRGFAVVASEVKGLADQTAAATAQIHQQIGDIQKEGRAAVQGIEDIMARFETLRTGALAISTAMSQQSSTTSSIGEGMRTAAEGSESAFKRVTGAAEAVERTAEGARAVEGAAERINSVSASLRSVVTDFLATVRTT